MKKNTKLLISFFIAIGIMFIFQQKVQAKSYYIDEMDIKATILENGDVEVEQTLEYSFNGEYNGIYITIPLQYENKEGLSSKLNDEMYNAQKVELKSVKQIKNNKEILYNKTIRAYNGDNKLYTETVDNEEYELKIYSPSKNENKVFKVNYILKNLCVKHNDVGELYYNFIGGEWQCTIKQLSINIWLPYNTSELKAWGHGPDNGVTEIVDNTHVRLKVSNVATGKYVAARVVFDKNNIVNSNKMSNIDAYNIIYEDEQQIAKISDAKQNYTKIIYIFALILLVYWIILLFKYEKDKKYKVININEDELFEKYNKMLAECLQGSRDILARDIIAVILNLIDKKYIELDIINSHDLDGKDTYEYFLKKVPETENKLDEVEKFVYDWIFESTKEPNLVAVLKRIAKDEKANEKFKNLNKLVQKKLNEKGANKNNIPKILRIFNTILFVIAVFVAIKHMLYEGFEIYTGLDMFFAIAMFCISIFPLALMLLYIPIMIIITVRHSITKLVHKITGQRVVTTTITIITIFIIILILTILFVNPGNRYVLADEILICIALIIMFTDNLMLKNSVNMIEDYSRLNSLKDKIEDYTMMEDRDIEQVTLWGKYLAYSVSFGIAEKISKRIKDLHIDDDLLGMLNNKNLNEYITTDYSFFYLNASLDRRFAKNYLKKIEKRC